jgi:hypothetical protein
MPATCFGSSVHKVAPGKHKDLQRGLVATLHFSFSTSLAEDLNHFLFMTCNCQFMTSIEQFGTNRFFYRLPSITFVL